MKTFTILFRDGMRGEKIRARSLKAAIAMAIAMGADRVFQGGWGWDSGWLKK